MGINTSMSLGIVLLAVSRSYFSPPDKTRGHKGVRWIGALYHNVIQWNVYRAMDWEVIQYNTCLPINLHSAPQLFPSFHQQSILFYATTITVNSELRYLTTALTSLASAVESVVTSGAGSVKYV